MNLRMGRLFLLSVVLFVWFAAPLLAQDRQYAMWEPDNGIEVRQGFHMEWYRSMARDDDGNLLVVWSDTHQGDRNIYGLLFDPDGSPLWTTPIAIADGEGRQEDPHAMADGNGNWIITWVDFRYDFNIEDKGDIFMMKVDSQGNRLWNPASGVPVCSEYPNENYIQIGVQSFTDGNGGAVSIWVDARSGAGDLYVQHMDSNGNAVWAENGIAIASGEGNQGTLTGGGYTADTDGAGGVIAGWTDNRVTDINVYAQRIDADGDLIWNSGDVTGMEICTVAGEQASVKMAPDGEGGAFFVWQDKRTDTAFGDLFMQRIDASGNEYWTTNGEILVDDEGLASPKFQRAPRITNVGAGEAVVLWEDSRQDPSNIYFDIYMQKISGTTAPVFNWGENNVGLVLCDAQNDQAQARLTSNGNGGIFVTWVDERDYSSPNHDLYGSLIQSDGSLATGWDDNGTVISNARLAQEGNIVRRLGDGHYASVWLDFQFGSPSLFLQVYTDAGATLIAEEDQQLVYGIDFDARSPRLIRSDENYYIAWSDGRSVGSSVIYMHRVDLDGNLLWTGEETENGITITPMVPDPTGFESAKFDSISYSPDGLGGVIAAWHTVNTDGVNEVYIQRITEDGELPWGDTGVEVYDALFNDQTEPFVISDGGNGYIVVFHQLDDNWYQNIVFMLVDANGQAVWDAPIPIAGGEINNYVQDVFQYTNNDILVVYKTEEESGATDLFAQCISVDGIVRWEESVVISDAEENQSNAVITGVAGDVVIAWEDTRRGSSIVDIYGQRISSDGSTHWADNGMALIEENLAQSSIAIGSKSPDVSNFWLAWRDNRVADNIDIYTMLFDQNGSTLLTPSSGINLAIDDINQDNPEIAVLDDNSAYIAWESAEGAMFTDLYFKHVLWDGSIATIYGNAYPDEGAILCDAYHRQESVQMETVPVDGEHTTVIAVWEDLRATGKDFLYNIYSQKINDGSSLTDVPGSSSKLPAEFSLDNAYPNPFNPSTSIGYVVPQSANVRLSVYDVLGRKVTELVNGKKAAGEYTAIWNGHSSNGQLVASGTYFVRLEADGVKIAKSVILLK